MVTLDRADYLIRESGELLALLHGEQEPLS
jgi:hypothetical protein